MPLITRNSQNANVKLGTTAQLSALTFTDGDLASDTTLNKLKIFDGSTLQNVGATSFSSSAVVSQSTTIANYTTPTAAVSSSPSNATCEYLVVGGGGGGGSHQSIATGAGGGAGGFLIGSGLTVSVQTYAITVGVAGGINEDGSNSVFSSLTAIGGGRGGRGNNTAVVYSGGSGGGHAGNSSGAGGAGTSGQGFAGGTVGSSVNASSGGGGSSAVGGNATNETPPAAQGGAGTVNTISGSSVTYATGGNGVINGQAGSGPVSGIGFGGSGGSSTTAPSAGTDGIVIIKYLSSDITATGGTIITSGNYKIHTFTTSGSFIVSSAVTDISGLAIDNNTATKWISSSESNPNIYVDMGSALNLCAAAFYFDSTGTTNTEILIQSSADALTWTTRRTITESNLTDGAYNYYRFNIAGGSRYIRFYGNSAGSTVLSIWEIKILKKTDAEIFNDLGMLTITPNDTTLGADGT